MLLRKLSCNMEPEERLLIKRQAQAVYAVRRYDAVGAVAAEKVVFYHKSATMRRLSSDSSARHAVKRHMEFGFMILFALVDQVLDLFLRVSILQNQEI